MMNTPFDRENPLARIARESESANQSLDDYAKMGPGRSLAKLLERYAADATKRGQIANGEGTGIPPVPPTLSLKTLGGWSKKYRWVDRVAAWVALEREKDDQLWEERRRALKEQDWGQGGLLRERVEDFLKQLPRFVRSSSETIERDGVTTTVVTVALNTTLAEVATVLKTASGLQRLAAEEPTDRVQYSGNLLNQLIARELAELADSGQAGDAGASAPDEGGEDSE